MEEKKPRGRERVSRENTVMSSWIQPNLKLTYSANILIIYILFLT